MASKAAYRAEYLEESSARCCSSPPRLHRHRLPRNLGRRYAPEVRRLHEKFAAQGVEFSLVYPNPMEPVTAIRRHLKDYSYPMRALRDPRQELSKVAGATITPEAAVFDTRGRVLYRGRIDDRYVSLGVERPVATRRDLDEALTEIVAGKTPSQTTTQAVGCFIADFAR